MYIYDIALVRQCTKRLTIRIVSNIGAYTRIYTLYIEIFIYLSAQHHAFICIYRYRVVYNEVHSAGVNEIRHIVNNIRGEQNYRTQLPIISANNESKYKRKGEQRSSNQSGWHLSWITLRTVWKHGTAHTCPFPIRANICTQTQRRAARACLCTL